MTDPERNPMVDDERFARFMRHHLRESRRLFNEFFLEHQGEADWTSDTDFVQKYASLLLDDPEAAKELQDSLKAAGAAELAGRAALLASWWLYFRLLKQLNQGGLLARVIQSWEEEESTNS